MRLIIVHYFGKVTFLRRNVFEKFRLEDWNELKRFMITEVNAYEVKQCEKRNYYIIQCHR